MRIIKVYAQGTDQRQDLDKQLNLGRACSPGKTTYSAHPCSATPTKCCKKAQHTPIKQPRSTTNWVRELKGGNVSNEERFWPKNDQKSKSIEKKLDHNYGSEVEKNKLEVVMKKLGTKPIPTKNITKPRIGRNPKDL